MNCADVIMLTLKAQLKLAWTEEPGKRSKGLSSLDMTDFTVFRPWLSANGPSSRRRTVPCSALLAFVLCRTRIRIHGMPELDPRLTCIVHPPATNILVRGNAVMNLLQRSLPSALHLAYLDMRVSKLYIYKLIFL